MNCIKVKTIIQLLDYARRIYPTPKYRIQKIAYQFGVDASSISMLFLPVGHPELYPIEIVWASVKRAVEATNVNFHLKAVER